MSHQCGSRNGMLPATPVLEQVVAAGQLRRLAIGTDRLAVVVCGCRVCPVEAILTASVEASLDESWQLAFA